jgi:hypothetical protein
MTDRKVRIKRISQLMPQIKSDQWRKRSTKGPYRFPEKY